MTIEPILRRVSTTELEAYFYCGEQWRRRYIEREWSTPTEALVLGRVVSDVVEYILRAKMENPPRYVSAAEAVSTAIDIVDRQLRKNGLQLADGEDYGKVTNRMRGRMRRFAQWFVDEVAPKVVPVLVEAKIEFPIPDVGIVIVGRIDLLDASWTVSDWKYGKPKTQRDADDSDQLTFYDLLVEFETGQRPNGFMLASISSRADGLDHNAEYLYTQRDDRDREVLGERISEFVKGTDAGVALPAAPGSWKCQPKFCEFYGTCRFVNGARMMRRGK